jgi:hypothetical protein
MTDDLDVAAVHRLFEIARPKSLNGDPLKHALTELYDATQPHFERLLKRPDGARIFQLAFRRGDRDLRDRLLGDLTPHFWTIATTYYSYHIFLTIVRHGRADTISLLVQTFRGKFDALLSHAVGMKSADALWHRARRDEK